MSTMRTWLAVAGLVAATTLGACADSSAPGGDGLTAEDAADAGLAQVDEVSDVTDALDVYTVAGGAVADQASVAGLNLNVAGPPHAGCATISSLVDSDGDGTPDDATFTYLLPACHFENEDGGTLDLTGTIRVVDPTPTAADLNRSVTLTDFTRDFTAAQGRSFTAVRNGNRQRSGSSTSLTLNNNVTVVRTVVGKPPATIVHTLQAVFTPVAGSEIIPGAPLPDGTISVSGAFTWSRNGHSRDFTATTLTPLVYDASCSGPRRDRIAGGSIQWTLPGGRTIVTTWTACGVPPTRQVTEPGASST